jgi:hypothetical protein
VRALIEIGLTIAAAAALIYGTSRLAQRFSRECDAKVKRRRTQSVHALLLGVFMVGLAAVDFAADVGPGTGWTVFILGMGSASVLYGLVRLASFRTKSVM